MFFSFDGIDGAGKSTQMEQFCHWLRQQGLEPVTCRDPGTTRLGETLRQLLLDPQSPPIGTRSEMLIYMAARAQLVDEVIRPARNEGKVVVSDRFLLANVVYQGHAGGMDVETLWNVGRIAVEDSLPDMVFLLDLDVTTAAQRRGSSADRMEQRGVEYLQRVREGFLSEAKRFPDQIAIIDAGASEEAVQRQIRELAHPWVREKKG
jgi:dTMP kinase